MMMSEFGSSRNVTRSATEVGQAMIRLGFLPGESDGRKAVQLTFLDPDGDGRIVYRIPFVSDGAERMTLLVHQAGFSGHWRGFDGIPPHIREETHRKLAKLIGRAEGQGAEAEEGRQAFAEPDRFEGMMVQDESDMVRLGKEMKAMKTNSELREEGMIPDPIQHG